MTHFWADFARFRGAFFSITHYFLDFSEGKKKIEMRYAIPSALAITAAVDFFFQFAVFQKLLTENKMDILSRTDHTHNGTYKNHHHHAARVS